MIIIRDIEQGSDDWFNLRLGIPTASNFSKILKKDGSHSASADRYMFELAMERISSKRKKSFSNPHTDKGHEQEPESRDYYALTHGVTVEEVSVCYKDERKRYSCSPDGLILEKNAGFEVKNKDDWTQWGYIQKPDTLLTEVHRQVQGSLYITDLDYWDVLAYHQDLENVEFRVLPDRNFFDYLEVRLETFCDELDKLTEQLGNSK